MAALSKYDENMMSSSYDKRVFGPRAMALKAATEAALASAPPIELRPLPKSVLQRKVPDELARSFTPLEAKELRDAFSLFDYEGCGFIALQDLENVFIELGEAPTPDDLAQLLASVQLASAQTISFGDFCHMVHHAKPHQHASAYVNTAPRVPSTLQVENSTTIRYDDGSVFQGQCSHEGMFHGLGKYKNASSGDEYTGDFRNGSFHGAGHLWSKDGSTYEGEFAQGIKDGPGLQNYRDGSSFVGTWNLGLVEGYGEYRCASGDVYKGEFSRGKKNGAGKLFYRDGGTFEGQWAEDHRQAGSGIMTLSNGDVYEGEFNRIGLYHGEGKLTHGESGDVYEGQFMEGKKHGLGSILYREGGDEYEGEWRKGTKTGQGKYCFADGNSYEGEWLNDRMEGRGRYMYSSGDTYDGDFLLDQPHGQGKATYANGDCYEGSFKGGLPCGKGTMTYHVRGEKWTGEWKKGMRVMVETAPAEEEEKEDEAAANEEGKSQSPPEESLLESFDE